MQLVPAQELRALAAARRLYAAGMLVLHAEE